MMTRVIAILLHLGLLRRPPMYNVFSNTLRLLLRKVTFVGEERHSERRGCGLLAVLPL
jgi:hypothetical protein